MALATTGTIVPYWQIVGWSEARWEDFVMEEQARAEGKSPDIGILAISKQYSVSAIELEHLRLEAGLKRDEGQRKESLANRFLIASEIAIDATLDKLQDERVLSELDVSDSAKIARQMSDANINLKNGTTAAPTINVLNWTEIKQVVNMAKEMQEPFKPVIINAEEPRSQKPLP